MTDEGVVVLGIPIPSSSPVFLSIVAVHVAAGLVCTIAGIGAMLTPKRAGRHPSAGAVYYWSLLVVFVSMATLSILRWPENTHLFVLGILSFGAGTIGRMARRRLWHGWAAAAHRQHGDRIHPAAHGVLRGQWTTPAAVAFAAGPGVLAPAEHRRRSYSDLGTDTPSAHTAAQQGSHLSYAMPRTPIQPS
jgi:hypothetical protein